MDPSDLALPAPGAPAPGRHDAEGRRQALIAAATSVFAEYGYEAATTREVAARAGCAEGLIHRYFGGKRGLLLAILEWHTSEIVQHYRDDLPERHTLIEEIEQLLVARLDTMWDVRDFVRVAVSQSAIDRAVGSSIAGGIHAAQVRQIRARLERHRAAGRIRADADIEAAAEMLASLGFQLGFMQPVAMGVERERVRRIALAAAAVIARGLEA